MSRYDPNILAKGLDVVFCGINPGTSALRSGHSFSAASNRFWPVLHLSGFTPMQLRPEEERKLLDYGCGITAVVERATASAGEVAPREFRLALPSLERKIRDFSPRCLAFLGKRAIAAIRGEGDVPWGRQAETIGGTMIWVLPNPSGLNRGFSLPMLVEAYSVLREALAPSTR
jgi:TDG/mug DNA glycosylase family protein